MTMATTPEPPYYAVIFTSLHTDDRRGYAQMAEAMVSLARQQDGFLGVESARDSVTSKAGSNDAGQTDFGLGITVSYWRDLDSIKRWKQQADHLKAQENGKAIWYADYTTRIALVEREYSKPV